ncbi:MAG TPA: dTDP-4-amino-4,6-dideoxygalactose transaminase [Flavipsychrobacter sp.]|nr:dTDP-4-amino-4,6-dideoxygalactose transaminase [Flavipsychrobacter sp.]
MQRISQIDTILENLEKQQAIPFNKPFLTGYENYYLSMVFSSGKLAGDGFFTKQCENFFNRKFNFRNSLLVTSCTHALEMSALLMQLKPGDEVIIPSFTFVSTANAFMLFGAKIVFADSRKDHPGIDESSLESLITKRTKAIVVVHYAGVACDMDKIMAVAHKNNLFVVEDTAHGIDAYYHGRPLGSIGDMGTFSFHETKNITCGEGGLLNVSNEELLGRAEIIREKGTDRSKFLRGEIDKYSWVGIGSSYVLSEMNAAFLLAQLEQLEKIQAQRLAVWHYYYEGLKELEIEGLVKLPVVPKYASNNAHIFYMVLKSEEQRQDLILYLKSKNIHSVFHYSSLHTSQFFTAYHDGRNLPNSDFYTDGLLRLPLYCELTQDQSLRIVEEIQNYFKL